LLVDIFYENSAFEAFLVALNHMERRISFFELKRGLLDDSFGGENAALFIQEPYCVLIYQVVRGGLIHLP